MLTYRALSFYNTMISAACMVAGSIYAKSDDEQASTALLLWGVWFMVLAAWSSIESKSTEK